MPLQKLHGADRRRPYEQPSAPAVGSDAGSASSSRTPTAPPDQSAGRSGDRLRFDGQPRPGRLLLRRDPYRVGHPPNPRQPRVEFDPDLQAELVESIQEVGLLQPVVVRPPLPGQRFELVMGERRWRASKEAGKTAIPAIVRGTEEGDMLRDALLENLHRAQLNPLEEANAYQQLLDDFGCTQEELSQRIKRSRPQISNTLRLLKLPAPVQRRIAAGVLSAGHAKALLSLSDPAHQEHLAQRVVAEGLSVRATEELVHLSADTPPAPTSRPAAKHPHPPRRWS